MEDFYNDAVAANIAAAERLIPVIRQQESAIRYAELVARDAQSAIDSIRTVHVRSLQAVTGVQQLADAAGVIASSLRPLAESVNLRVAEVMAAWQPIFGKVELSLAKQVSLGLSAAMKPSLDRWDTVFAQWHGALAADAVRILRSADWESIAAAANAASAAYAGSAGGDVVLPRPLVTAATEATAPAGKALPERIAGLTCGQALMLVVIVLAVLLYFDLPPETRSRIEGLITVLTAAIWAASLILRQR